MRISDWSSDVCSSDLAAFPGRVLARTVDQGLRPESAAEADMVTRFCRDLGVGHRTLVLDGLDGAAGNIQARARAARYAAMTAVCRAAGAGVLKTGHHADAPAAPERKTDVWGQGVARGIALGGRR